MASADTMLLTNDGDDGSSVVAQYLVTKITFWGSYRRILTLTPSHIALYNPDDFTCTNQWLLSVITDIEITPDPDHFILVVEKVRFQPTKLRFHCHARSHLIALLHKLRLQYSFVPLRIKDYDPTARQQHYDCSEHFADGSHDFFLLHVGLAGVSLLDENASTVARFSYLAIQRIAISSAHPDGLVISTLFQERLFLCHPREDCIDHMCAAALAMGVTLPVDASPLNMQLLRLRNSQALDHPAVACFDVIRLVDDGETQQPVQLILQGVAMVEVHRKLRTIITRPYSLLLTIVPSQSDADVVVLEFAQGETLVVCVDARDQFIALLLLVCREAGNEQVDLGPAMIRKNRRFHPHITEKVKETAGTSMESFFLRRVLRALAWEEPAFQSSSLLRESGRVRSKRGGRARRREHGRRTQPQRKRGLRSNAVMVEARLAADTGASLNDHITVTIALEELNANVPLTGFSDNCNRALLSCAIEALLEHLGSQVPLLRAYGRDAPTAGIVTTLQSLTRMAQSHHAFIPEDLVPSLLDALREIVSSRQFLPSYWVLKLLQRYFEPRKNAEARRHRAKALETFVESRDLLYTILDLIPAASSLSTSSSGRWMRPGSEGICSAHNDHSNAYLDQEFDQTLLFTKEERLEKDMSILTYEALFTLHHVLIFLLVKEKKEGEEIVSILSKTQALDAQRAAKIKTKDWTATISLCDSEYDVALHEERLELTTTAKREIGEKLLSKHRFLMDAVVDVRLARSCQTIVALINFLVHFFSQELDKEKKAFQPTRVPPGGFVLYEDERADPDGTILFQIGSDTEYRRKRATLPMRRSYLDDPIREYGGEEETEAEAHERKLNEMFAFLECYQADVATLDDRSRLFPEQRTILLPLFSFSHASSTDSSNHSFFYVSSVSAELARVRERDQDFLTLDELVFEEEHCEEKTPQEARSGHRVEVASLADTKRERKRTTPPLKQQLSHTQTRPSRDVKPSLLVHPSSSEGGYSVGVDSLPQSSGQLSSSRVPRFMNGSNFRRLDVARHETLVQNQAQKQQKKHETLRDRGVVVMVKPAKVPDRWQRPPHPRPAPVIPADVRISAHTCDACIACNDVCESTNCFFCAEKEYQLQVAFTETSLPRSSHSATRSSSFNTERKYSSCEVRRHQSARSCWVVIFGFVYDVTDLLSSHPGGMDVLLTAAAVGKDMGELFVAKHPARAKRVLENYYLGEFYQCENRTVLA